VYLLKEKKYLLADDVEIATLALSLMNLKPTHGHLDHNPNRYKI
jgi:hypothetical protein